MRLINFTIIKLTLFLIIGIIFGYFITISITLSLLITGMLFLILSIVFFISKKQYSKNIWFGLVSFLLMISIGVMTVNCHNQKNFKSHYTNIITNQVDTLTMVTFKVRELLKPSSHYNKYVVDILKIDGKETKGKTLLKLTKDTLNTTLKIDAIYICKTELKPIHPPLNPGQFDYKNYLNKKYIYHQIVVSPYALFKTNIKFYSLFGTANVIRDFINLKLKNYHFKPDELSIINALLLGQRQDISEAIYTSYTNAGVIHILAISGLHIGIILILLNIIFNPLEHLKNGKLIKTILIVFILWSFAIIAGLSASVTRAVTMFSIVAIGMNLKRPTNIFNTLAISVFILLLAKPLFLFDVGFQLSYMAVLAIVIIHPLLHKLWSPKYKIVNIYWQTLTVTVAAQLGILPLSLYYFHQIPSLFFLTNLVIIPVLGIILGYGIIVILLAVLNILPQFLADIFGYIISAINSFVSWFSNQSEFIIKNISFSILYLLASYVLIATLINFWKQKSYRSLKLVLIGIVILQCAIIFTHYSKPSNQFIIFHKSAFSLIANVSKNKINVSHNLDSITQSKNQIITDFTVQNYVNNIETDSLKNLYILNNKTVFIIDHLSAYNVKSFQPDYILLRQSPKLNLNRLIDSIKPKQIIADGSNYKSYIKHWEAICKKQKLPFHQTGKKGAFIIEY